MGILGALVVYKLGKRSERRKRDRQERREEFLEEWENTKTIVDDEYHPLDGSE